MIDPDQVKEFALWIKSGAAGAFGGLIGYLLEVQKGRVFGWGAYVLFILAAFIVGSVLGDMLPEELPGKGGLLMVAGTIAHPLLSKFQEFVMALVDKVTGK